MRFIYSSIFNNIKWLPEQDFEPATIRLTVDFYTFPHLSSTFPMFLETCVFNSLPFRYCHRRSQRYLFGDDMVTTRRKVECPESPSDRSTN